MKNFTLVARVFGALNSPCTPTISQKLQELCSFLAFWCPPWHGLNSLVDAFLLPCNQKLALPMQNHFSSSRSPCTFWIPLRRITFAPGTVHINPWTSSILKSPSCPRHVLTSLWADLPATVPTYSSANILFERTTPSNGNVKLLMKGVKMYPKASSYNNNCPHQWQCKIFSCETKIHQEPSSHTINCPTSYNTKCPRILIDLLYALNSPQTPPNLRNII